MFEAIKHLARDIQDDIVSDVYLSILEHGVPHNFDLLLEDMMLKNIELYLKQEDTQKLSSYMISQLENDYHSLECII